MYLDHNATSPMPQAVQDAVFSAMSHAWANPGSPHALGQASAAQVQRSRQTIAEALGVPPKQVFFTSGATEGNAWVLSQKAMPVVASATEHPSVLDWSSEVIAVNESGLIDLQALEARLKSGPALVSVMAANNETGVMQPIEAVYDICQRHDAPFHCDATQVFGRIGTPVCADYITVSAHKFGGPRGVGALITSQPPSGILKGGKQERGHRAGTLNVPGIVGFAAALSAGQQWTSDERDKLEAFCKDAGGKIIGERADRLPNTLSVLFSHPGDLIIAALDLHGVYASTGSACSSGSSQTSHVLSEMGIDGTPVRFSFGPGSTAQPAIQALTTVLSQLEGACV